LLRVRVVVLQVISKVDEFKPQELANVVWALASMEHHSAELMEVGGCAVGRSCKDL
jgi:hypothetical protein